MADAMTLEEARDEAFATLRAQVDATTHAPVILVEYGPKWEDKYLFARLDYIKGGANALGYDLPEQPRPSSTVADERARVASPAPQDARLAEIEARAAAATPGPWLVWDTAGSTTDPELFIHGGNANRPIVRFDVDDDPEADLTDAPFIAHAREDIPYLLSLVRSHTADREAQ